MEEGSRAGDTHEGGHVELASAVRLPEAERPTGRTLGRRRPVYGCVHHTSIEGAGSGENGAVMAEEALRAPEEEITTAALLVGGEERVQFEVHVGWCKDGALEGLDRVDLLLRWQPEVD